MTDKIVCFQCFGEKL